MIPQGSSFQNSTSSGVGGGDQFGNKGPQMGSIFSGGSDGASISKPVMFAALAVVGLYFWSRK
ncbi:hypothetical protein SAMN05421686_10730 [Thalassolituus maritimus]|jgi:hypothetical protein|uniref:Uncharacterized protein n=1 Tax=Thalassolituus maritimus TaxID=484498 RepID=A0A1N7NIE9_9GAMM|nr:hypothetical protein [Thalassolituus maritimus]SIS97959.1 hypothetical protein SAMN05421686_10730 [Thalassolituus maritimus]